MNLLKKLLKKLSKKHKWIRVRFIFELYRQCLEFIKDNGIYKNKDSKWLRKTI